MTRSEAKALLLSRLENFPGGISTHWWNPLAADAAFGPDRRYCFGKEAFDDPAELIPEVREFLLQHGCPAMSLSVALGQDPTEVHDDLKLVAGGAYEWFPALSAEPGSPARVAIAAQLEQNFEELADRLGLPMEKIECSPGSAE
jgi:hypothetical protein